METFTLKYTEQKIQNIKFGCMNAKMSVVASQDSTLQNCIWKTECGKKLKRSQVK